MFMDPTRPTRRQALAAGAAAALAAVLAPRLTTATEAEVAAAIRTVTGDRTLQTGRVRINIPDLVENGLGVPLTLEVDSPMTEADHVRAVHVFAEGNPSPQVLTYRFTPESGRAAASTRIRLAQSQGVVCVAEMSDGSVFAARAEVQVTIGGCGG